jgi:two-component system sensor histidine kinase ChiS
MTCEKSEASLYKDVWIFTTIITVIISVISLFIGISEYKIAKADKYDRYRISAIKASQTLTELFSYLNHYMSFIGKKIVQQGHGDNDIIAQLLSDQREHIQDQYAYSWSLFDWVTPDKMMTINSIHGKLSNPIDMSSREYLEFTSLYPWKLQFSQPMIGILSGQFVIPIGIGVKHKGEFYGTIGSGIRLEEVNDKIQHSIVGNEISFILLDDKSRMITQSIDIMEDAFDSYDHKTYRIDQFSREECSEYHGSYLDNAIPYNNKIQFDYCLKIKDYPYYLLLGSTPVIASQSFKTVILPRIAELVCLGIICILLLYFFHKRIIKPIIVLSEMAKKIAVGEKVTIANPSSYRELGILAHNLEEIQTVKEELVDTKDNLEQRTADLEKALKVKTEVLNNISHEVKTPIHGITGISRGLVKCWDRLTDAERKQDAELMAKAANRLFSLMSNLLDLSKIRVGKMVMDMESTNFKELVDEMIDECQMLYINGKNIKLIFEVRGDVTTLLMLDKDRITQVLRNLFANAIKFTKEGIIKATLSEYRNNLLFELEDDGVGIPDAELTEIFEPFIQSSRTKTGAGGTGLGLAICQEIIKAHHGEIWAENKSTGGAKLYFTIPIRKVKDKNRSS